MSCETNLNSYQRDSHSDSEDQVQSHHDRVEFYDPSLNSKIEEADLKTVLHAEPRSKCEIVWFGLVSERSELTDVIRSSDTLLTNIAFTLSQS